MFASSGPKSTKTESLNASFSSSTAAYYLPRHLAPNPAYPHPYPYLIRGFPDTAALENRQTLLNDYITSQQMHQWPAMAAQRSDLLRGLTPRDQPLPLPYSAAPRGEDNRPTHFSGVFPGFGAGLIVIGLKKIKSSSVVLSPRCSDGALQHSVLWREVTLEANLIFPRW